MSNHSDFKIEVLRGVISELRVSNRTITPSAGLHKPVAAGAIPRSVGDEAVGADSLSYYDSEDVEHFSCKVGIETVSGTFERVTFVEGDELIFLADADKDGFWAIAAVRQKDGLLWMPYSLSKGRWRVAQWILVATFLYVIAMMLAFAMLIFFSQHVMGYWEFMGEAAPFFIGITTFIFGGVYWSSFHEALYTERILERLGFRQPGIVNLSPFSQARLGTGASYQIYDLRKALAAYNST